MSLTNGTNGSSNGNGNGSLPGAAAVLTLLRRPTLALLRRYADWVEHTSTIEVSGPGASYAGSAVYVCRSLDVPLVFLHRAHYDDRTLLDSGPHHEALALFAHAAGLVVSRGHETPPEMERSVRAGNGVIYVVGDNESGRRSARLAASLALRTNAPVIPITARATRLVRLPWMGDKMGWPRPRNEIHLSYGPLEQLDGDSESAAERIQALLS
jgi:hypothetical protein